jgi:hypothetical protein
MQDVTRHLKKHERELAHLLIAEIEAFADISPSKLDNHHRRIRITAELGIPFTPSVWLGTNDPARRMRLVRANRRLESQRLLRRTTQRKRDRTVFVVPTAELLAHGLRSLGTKVDLDAFRQGLNRTKWGRDLCEQLTELLPAVK